MSKVNYEKRLRIKEMLDKKEKKKDIASELGISRQALYKELQRGLVQGESDIKLYDPYIAQSRALSRIGEVMDNINLKESQPRF